LGAATCSTPPPVVNDQVSSISDTATHPATNPTKIRLSKSDISHMVFTTLPIRPFLGFLDAIRDDGAASENGINEVRCPFDDEAGVGNTLLGDAGKVTKIGDFLSPAELCLLRVNPGIRHRALARRHMAAGNVARQDERG
jgi:hypothetical protein